MKKLLLIIILSVFLVGLVVPITVRAQPIRKLNECCKISSRFKAFNIQFDNEKVCIVGEPGGNCVIDGSTKTLTAGFTITDGGKCGVDNAAEMVRALEGWGMVCLVNTVYNVANWIFFLMMAIVVVMIVIGGATYMLAAGDPTKAGKGKKIIVYGIIGLVIALIARFIPSVVKLIVGM